MCAVILSPKARKSETFKCTTFIPGLSGILHRKRPSNVPIERTPALKSEENGAKRTTATIRSYQKGEITRVVNEIWTIFWVYDKRLSLVT